MNRFFIALISSLLLAGPCHAEENSKEPLGPDKWPMTVEATVKDILSSMSEQSRKTIRDTPEGDLIMFHRGWGTGIRNHYGLWRGNRSLLENACGKGCHPDEASMVIIKAVWRRLQDKS
jgi:hypothetical protein